MRVRRTSQVIDTLVIIGVGLIGGSLARALRRSGAVGEIVGVGRSAANLEAAVDLGVVDRFEFDAAKAVRGADMVVVAVTLGASAEILETIGPALDENTFVTDVGSTKLSVVTSARAALGARFPNFVPGHPIAGTELSGVKASFAELFEDHKVILTPLLETREEAIFAMAKLAAVIDSHETGLAADTVVVLDGEVLGKPGRPDWATDMLHRLSGRTHEVVGGLAVCHGGHTISGVVRTRVTFRALGDDEIDAYVATGEPLDKAGAYAIQGGAAGFVAEVDGCRENVVGLSIPAVLAALKSLGAQSAG